VRRGGAPYILSRIIAFRTVIGTVVSITFIAATVLCALAVYEGGALQSAAEARLAAADTSLGVETSAGTPVQFAAQATTLRDGAGAALGAGSFTQLGAISTDQVALPTSTQAQQQLVELAGLSALSTHATLVAGQWPRALRSNGSSPIPVAVPLVVATRLHITVGAMLTLQQTAGGPPVKITIGGIYQPRRANGPYWRLSVNGAAGIGSTTASTTYGPVAVDPAAFTSGALTGTQTRWAIQPAVSALAARSPPPLRRRSRP
jgi:hypothetical protein